MRGQKMREKGEPHETGSEAVWALLLWARSRVKRVDSAIYFQR